MSTANYELPLSFTAYTPDHARGTLLFIHGSAGSRHVWQRQLESLPEGFSAVAIDLPGHGESPGQPCASVASYASSVASLISRAGWVHPLVAVGHSLGAAIALTLGLDHSETVDGVVAIGGGARMRVNPQFLANLAEGRFDPGFLALAFSSHADPDLVTGVIQEASQVPPEVPLADFSACNAFDIRERLRAFNRPLLIIVGEDDRLTPVKLSREIHDAVSGSELAIIPGAGHFAMLEEPDQVSKLIHHFVSRLE